MLEKSKLSPKALAFKGLNYASLEDSVLATIINARVEDIDLLQTLGTREEVRPSSLKRALRGIERHFIFECKKASPTLGDINQSLDLEKLAHIYSKEANAISVLCEPRFFKGSYENLRFVKQHTSLPVICKDFIISKKQIDLAYEMGADAILLMCSVLDRQTLIDFYNYATSLGLDCIVEVHTKDEADFAYGQLFPIVGINNRDLKTLKINFETSKKLSFLLKDVERSVISESGVKNHLDVKNLNPFKNFLIGSSICEEKRPLRKIREIKYGLNKICGIKTFDALQALIDNKATLAGFILVKNSPRFIEVNKALELIDKTCAQDYLYTTAVFLNQDLNEVFEIAKTSKFDYLQFHGQESLAYIQKVKDKFPKLKLIKALNIYDPNFKEDYQSFAKLCDLILLDSKNPGSGKSFDWTDIPSFVDKSRTLLSGGIKLSNLKEALELGFIGLDLSSGAEIVKGQKDLGLIQDLMHKILE